MIEQKEIQKTPIDQIGKKEPKITIADTIVHESGYFVAPPMTLHQLASCWLDPSEMEEAYRHNFLVYVANEKIRIGKPGRDILAHYLAGTDALAKGDIRFAEEQRWEFASVKKKILKKFNLKNLRFKAQAFSIIEIIIESNVPFYDPHAHEKHVHNIIRAIKIRYPKTTLVLDLDQCREGGKCSIGIEKTLRKVAEETQRRNTA